MQSPLSKKQLSLYLGMVTYWSHYMSNILYLTSDLRDFLKKNALFQWSEAYVVSFEKIKTHVSEDLCLRSFNTTKDVVLQVDVFWVELGAVLLQDHKPVAYDWKVDTSLN